MDRIFLKQRSGSIGNRRIGMRTKCILFICAVSMLMLTGCRSSAESIDPEPELPIDIPEGEVSVAAYYFPNWGPVAESEWQLVKFAKPRFNGHQQPKIPLWGYENENEPAVMSKKIEAAAGHGIDAFIFDWYYFDPPYGKYLYKALEEGFLEAGNNAGIKFALLWCNHDVGDMKGAVTPDTFTEIMDYIIEKYFKHPSYWLIDGCPYFSIYQMHTFIETFGGDVQKAAEAIELFRSKVKAAGFKDLHLNGVLFGLNNYMDAAVNNLKMNSTTSYVWIHHNALPSFPATKYEVAVDQYFRSVENGGGANGLEKPAASIPVPYHLNVSMGWDSSPRCRNAGDWMQRRDYPYGAVITDNTPYLFKKALAKAKKITMEKPPGERIVTINSWNEWGEGSYLEPDTRNEMKYLEAVRDVFK